MVIALIRGIVARSGKSLGNFWHDLIRTLLYVLLPISIVGATRADLAGRDPELRRLRDGAHARRAGRQSIGFGPVASQEVIKELGTNGGGFFNANSAHPFENPTALSNFFEMLLILLIPASLTYTYGRMVGNRRQGWAIFSAMSILFVDRGRGGLHGRAARHAGAAPRRREHPPLLRLDRRQPRGQGAALRHRQHGALVRRSRP